MSDDELSEETLQAQALLRSAHGVYQHAKVHICEIPYIERTKRREDISDFDKLFAYAVSDLLHAQQLDPDVNIKVSNHNLNFDEITARILLLDAVLHLEARFYCAGEPKTKRIARDADGYSLRHLAHGLNTLLKYLTYKPDDIEGLLLCAKTLVRLDHDQDAITVLERARQVDPGNFEVRKLLEILRNNEHLDPLWLSVSRNRNPDIQRETSLREDANNTWYEPYPRSRLP